MTTRTFASLYRPAQRDFPSLRYAALLNATSLPRCTATQVNATTRVRPSLHTASQHDSARQPGTSFASAPPEPTAQQQPGIVTPRVRPNRQTYVPLPVADLPTPTTQPRLAAKRHDTNQAETTTQSTVAPGPPMSNDMTPEEAVRQHGRLVHFVLRKMGVQQADPSYDDYAQELLLHLARKAELWDAEKGTFSTFMSTCLIHKVLHLRKAERTENRRANYGALSFDAPLAGDDGTFTFADVLAAHDEIPTDDDDLKTILRREVDRLPEPGRTVMIGIATARTNDEIGERIGCSGGNVSLLKQQAIATLRARLRALGIDELWDSA